MRCKSINSAVTVVAVKHSTENIFASANRQSTFVEVAQATIPCRILETCLYEERPELPAGGSVSLQGLITQILFHCEFTVQDIVLLQDCRVYVISS